MAPHDLLPEWPARSGELARLIRNHDWAATPLGPVEGWPGGLRTLVDLMLGSGMVMCLMWGRDAVMLYNDAYARSIGQRHPGALGRSAREVWADVKDGWEPLFERAWSGEEAVTRNQHLRFTKSDLLRQEGWFDLTYTPVRNDGGVVEGVLALVRETTDPVLAEQWRKASEEHQRFLLRFSDALRAEPDVDAVANRAIQMLAEQMDLDRCYIAFYRPAEDEAVFPYQVGNDTVPPLPAKVRLSDFPEAYEQVLHGTFAVEDDLERRGLSDAEQANSRALGMRAMLASTLRRGERNPLASMMAVSSRARRWTPGEIALVEEAAERTWAAIERSRAEAALRESEAQQAFLLRLSDALRPLTDTDQIQATAARLLGEHLGALRVHYVEALLENQDLLLNGPGYVVNAPQITGLVSISDFDDEAQAAYQSGRTLIIPDVEAGDRSEVQLAAFRALGIRAALGVPLAKAGRLIGILSVHHGEPHDWTAEERVLVEQTAERTWEALERARTAAALRQSEERYQTLFAASPVPFMVLNPTPPDFTITDANEAYLVATKTTRENLIGRRLFDVFTDDPSRPGQLGSEALDISLHKVLATRQTDAMPRVRYDLVVPGGFEPHWWEAINAPMLDASGQVTAIIHQVQRVTELERAEAAERASQERQAFLLRLSDALRPLADPAEVQAAATKLLREQLDAGWCYYVEWNEAGTVARVLRDATREGLPSLAGEHDVSDVPEFLDLLRTGETLNAPNYVNFELLSPRIRGRYAALGFRSMLGMPLVKDRQLVATLLLGDTTIRHWSDTAVALALETAERTWAAVERARAEAALRASEERLQRVLETDAVAVLFFDRAGRLVDANEVFLRMTGHSRTEVEAGQLTWRTMTPPEWMEDSQRQMQALTRTGRVGPYEKEYLLADGSRRWMLFAGRDLGDGTVVEFAIDIAGRKEAEEALRASEARLSEAFKIDTVGVMFWGEGFGLTEVNDAFLRMTGFSREEALGKTWQELTPPEFHEASRRAIEEITTKGETTPYEKQYLRKDGSRWWGLFAARRVGDEVVEFVLDVSERREAEAAVRESEERLRAFGEASSDVLWIRDAETLDWTYLSPAFEGIYGLSREEALSGDTMGNWLDLIVPGDRERARAEIEKACQGERVTFEYRITRPSDGEVRLLRNTDFPIYDAAGRVTRIGGVGHDATEEQAAAERLQVLVHELQHRTRNLMGVVQSITNRTLVGSTSLEDFQTRIRDRLEALARVNGLLSRLNEGDRITFDELIRTELKGHGVIDGHDHGLQVHLQGPKGLRLRSSQVQTLALGLHELATNALKYGALSQPEGRLDISWHLAPGPDDKPRLRVDWRESGVEVAVPDGTADERTIDGRPPRRRGYGRELIEQALPYQLGAETAYELTPEGVRCTITLPLSST